MGPMGLGVIPDQYFIANPDLKVSKADIDAMAQKRADYFAAGTKVVWDVDVLRGGREQPAHARHLRHRADAQSGRTTRTERLSSQADACSSHVRRMAPPIARSPGASRWATTTCATTSCRARRSAAWCS